MGTMKFEVPHTLSKDEARKRVDQLLKYWTEKYGVKADWSGDGAKVIGKVMGINLDANFTITAGAIQGEGTDPGMLLRRARSEQERHRRGHGPGVAGYSSGPSSSAASA